MTEYIWFKSGHPTKHTEDESGELPTKVFKSGGVVINYGYYSNGNVNYKYYSKDGYYHRDGDKPAYISYYTNGDVKYAVYYKHGKRYTPTT